MSEHICCLKEDIHYYITETQLLNISTSIKAKGNQYKSYL